MMSKNISNKERTTNYVKFQIAQLDEIINDATQHMNPRHITIYCAPYIVKRNELYKELRRLTHKPNQYKKRTS